MQEAVTFTCALFSVIVCDVDDCTM